MELSDLAVGGCEGAAGVSRRRCGGEEECGIICGEGGNTMPAVMEQIDRMTTEEKFKTMDYIWSSLSVSDEVKFPAWHERELKATEERVAAGVERPIPWKTARAFLVGAV